ncbi:hypothetical protein PputUW4_03125 [Pseudomonas sp. UW4]|jgi:hypothetical protein|nr:hypothetical protein PputUW4_03125 [Pseudomonas sp. UW4]
MRRSDKPPRHYQLLASVLIDEVAAIIGPEALASLMRSMGRELDLALIGALGGGEVQHSECMVASGCDRTSTRIPFKRRTPPYPSSDASAG